VDDHKHNSHAVFPGLRIGLISDTHGLLRPQALDALRGCDRIVHAGDIGDAAILDALSRIAPLTAVRGNNDAGAWAHALRDDATLVVGNARIYVIHDVNAMRFDARARDVDVVISGHSHRPLVRERDGVTYVNPGSAGPRRFNLPISIGELVIAQDGVRANLVTLTV
jgi:putative phosphoesterase